MRSGPYSGKPCTYLPEENAASASSRHAVFAPCPPPAMPADLHHILIVHKNTSLFLMQSDIQKAAPSVKGRKPQTLRITTHYCIPTYASPDNGRVPAAPTTMFGLLFRSDVQTAATITGLSPPPARFGVCLRPTVFVITFPVFLTWLYHSRPGGICQYAFSVSRNNLFSVFCGVFVQVAHSFVHTQRTQVCLRRMKMHIRQSLPSLQVFRRRY